MSAIPVCQQSKIDSLLNKNEKPTIFHGRGAFEPSTTLPPSALRSAVNYLTGRRVTLQKTSIPRVRQASLASFFSEVVVERDPELLRGFRSELERAGQEASGDPTVQDCFLWPLFSIVPFTYPEIGDTFEFKGVTYTVTKRFDLDTIGGSIPAYVFEGGGQTILNFIGSTYPAGDGFAATWLSDCTPALSVGHIAARSSSLKEWFASQNQVTVVGASLGGALALQMVSLYGDRVKEVHAYNPAGLHLWNHYGEERCPVNIYYQDNDAVATMGYFPEWATVYRILPMKRHNFVVSHIRILAGEDEVTIVKRTGKEENSRAARHCLTAAHILLSPAPFALVGAPTLAYRIYEFFSLSYLSQKEATTAPDLILVISWIAFGALLIGCALFLLKNRALPQIKQLSQKAFIAITRTPLVLGGLMVVGGLRAATRLHSKKVDLIEAAAFPAQYRAPTPDEDLT